MNPLTQYRKAVSVSILDGTLTIDLRAPLVSKAPLRHISQAQLFSHTSWFCGFMQENDAFLHGYHQWIAVKFLTQMID